MISALCLSFFHPQSGPRSETVQRVTDHQTSCGALHWGQEVVKEGIKVQETPLGESLALLEIENIRERSQRYDGGINSNLMRINKGL